MESSFVSCKLLICVLQPIDLYATAEWFKANKSMIYIV